jgi:hypothetical protein
VAITTRDGLITALATAQRIPYYKASATAEGAGTFHSHFLLTGYPAAGATPPAYTAGSGYIPDNTTLGGLKQNDPTGGNTSYLLAWNHAGATAGRMILYDRVWHCSGLTTNGTNPTTLNVTTPGNISRPSNWLGLEIWLEVYSAPGATGSTWTVTYVDGADANKTAIYTHPANAESAGQMMPTLMADFATGVKSITSLTTTVASGTAGSIGITVMKRIAEFPNTLVNVGDTLDYAFLGMPQIPTDACLALMTMCSATNTGIASGLVVIGEG